MLLLVGLLLLLLLCFFIAATDTSDSYCPAIAEKGHIPHGNRRAPPTSIRLRGICIRLKTITMQTTTSEQSRILALCMVHTSGAA